MTLISNYVAKKMKNKKWKPRADGGYTRIMGQHLGKLLSLVHATVISSGTDLEHIIESHSTCMDSKQFSNFLNGSLANGTYLITKKIIKPV